MAPPSRGAPDPEHPLRRRIALGVVVALVLLTAGVALTLRSDRLTRAVLTRVARALTTADAVVVSGPIRGSRVASLHISDLTVRTHDTLEVLRVDSLSVEYSVLPLLLGAVRVRSVRVVNPWVDLRSCVVDGFALADGADEATPADSTSGWSVSIGRLALRGGSAVGGSCGAADSTWAVAGAEVVVADVRVGPGTAARVDTLSVDVTPAGEPADYVARLRARGRIDGGVLTVDTLSLVSPGSDVAVRGVLRRPNAPEGAPVIDFVVRARPIALRDLEPFVPALRADATVRVDAELKGAASALDVVSSIDLPDGGSIEIEGTVPAWRGALPTYRGSVTVTAFDPGALLDRAPGGAIDGEARLALEGPTLDAVTGSLIVAVGRAAGDPPPAELRLTVAFVDGLAEVDGRLVTDALRATLAGRARPFAATRSLALSGDAGWSAGPTSRLVVGRWEVEAEGAHADSLTGRALLRLDPSSWNDVPIPSGRVQVDLEQGTGTWSARAAVGDGGTVDATGDLTVTGLHVRIRRAVLDGIDLAALAGAGVGSAVHATLTGERTTRPSGAARWSGRVVADATTVGSMHVDSLTADGTLDGDRVDASLRVRALGGSLETRLGGTLGPDGSLELTLGRFDRLDVSAASGPGEGASALSGTLEGSWTRSDPTRGRVVVRLEPGRLRGLDLAGGSATATVLGDSVAIEGELSWAEGGLRAVAGGRRGPTGIGTWRLTEASFDALDMATLTGAGPVTRLSGTATATFAGATLDQGAGDGALVLRASSVGAWALDSARVEAALASGRADLDGTLAGSGASAELDATVELAEEATSFDGEVRVSVADLGGVLARDDVDGAGAASVRFAGDRTADGSLQARAQMRVRDATIQGVAVDSADAAVRYAPDGATLDTVTVRAQAIVVDGSGRAVPHAEGWRLERVELASTLLGPAVPTGWMGLPLTALSETRISVTGTPQGEALEVRADVDGGAVLAEAARADSFAATASATLTPDRALTAVDASAHARGLELGTLAFERVDATIVSENDGYAVAATGRIDATRRAETAAHVRLADDSTAIALRALDLALGDQTWRLSRDARVLLADGVQIDGLELASGSGRITADGAVRTTGAQSLTIELAGVRLAGIARLLGYEGLEGVLDGSARVTGTAASPILVATASARGALARTELAQLELRVRYDSLTLDAEGTLESGTAERGRFSATLPFEVTLAVTDSTPPMRLLEGGPLRASVHADSLDLAWIAPFVPPEAIAELAGTLRADVDVGGTTDRPRLEGSIAVADLSGVQPALGLSLERGIARLRLDGTRVHVEQASVRSGDGSLTLQGSVETGDGPDGAVDLSVTLDDFLAVRTDLFRGVVDGDLRVEGNAVEPAVSGSVDVLSGDVHLGGRFAGNEAEDVELTEEDWEMLETRFGYERPEDVDGRVSDSASALTLAVDVSLGRDVWVRQRASPSVSVQLTGDVRVEKAANERELVYGTLEAVPRGSYVEQFGRRFDITSGTIAFNGPPTELTVDIQSEYAVPSHDDPTASEVTIGLGVTGGLENLNVVLSSTPDMENADIVSYLATGQPASRSLQFESSDGGGNALVERGATLALGQATGALEELTSDAFGLDVMEIRTQGVSGATLVAGRYVSPRLYVGFKQSIRRGDASAANRARAPEIEIEFQAFRWLLLNLQRGGDRLELFLRSRYAY